MTDYTIELWDINGQMVMDVSAIASNRGYSLKLNDVENISFDLDLVQFERLCQKINTPPRTVLFPARTEVRIRRNGQYVVGGQVVKITPTINENGSSIAVQADGYLNYFLQRFIKKTWTNTDRSQIAWNAISTTQGQANGSFGITQGVLATTMNSDRIADYDEIKDIITDFTWHAGASPTANYDFEFTPEKVFNTYNRKGSDKPEIMLVYPQNIKSLSDVIDGSTVANKIIGIGSGMGDERIETIKTDVPSQIDYRVREKKQVFNSASVMATLENNTKGVLDLYRQTLEIPEVQLEPGAIDLNTVQTGDSVYVRVEGIDYLNNIDGMFRINSIDVKIDENDSEDVAIKFYNPKDGGALDEG